VYDPIARWTWSPEGWSNKRGSLDFAGGTAVHITAGSSVLAYGVFYVKVLPKIESYLASKFGAHSENDHVQNAHTQNGQTTTNTTMTPGSNHNPSTIAVVNPNHNSHRLPATEAGTVGQTNVILGSLFLWLGWFGFNGGSALGANLRAVSACMCTHLAACSGGVTFCLMSAVVEYIWPEEQEEQAGTSNHLNSRSGRVHSEIKPIKFSIVDFCNGAIIGLVCVTPAAGFVPHQVAPVFGIVGAFVCFLAMETRLNEVVADLHYIFVVHGVGGLVGMILTGFFARGQVSALDGVSSADRNKGGWDGRWIQIGFVHLYGNHRGLLLILLQEAIYGCICRSRICLRNDNGNSNFSRAVYVCRKKRTSQNHRWIEGRKNICGRPRCYEWLSSGESRPTTSDIAQLIVVKLMHRSLTLQTGEKVFEPITLSCRAQSGWIVMAATDLNTCSC
jgi:ammonia channel protein AmtB